MRADKLYEFLREALASEWMPDTEAAATREAFGRARESILSAEERDSPLGVPEPGDPSYERYHAALAAMGSLGHRQGDIRVQGLWDSLLGPIANIPQGAVSPDSITVRELRTRRLEASTLAADDGALILVDSALHDLVILHTSLILASSAVPFETIGGIPVPGPVLDVAVAVRAASSVHGHIRLSGSLGASFGIALPLPLDNLEHRVIEIVERFVLAHEYAHSYLGHLDGEVGRRRLNFGPVELEALLPDWSRELEADSFAAKLLFTDDEKGILAPSETLVHLLAIRIALFVLDQGVLTRYFSHAASHPSGGLRYGQILQRLFGLYGHPAIEVVEGVVGPYLEKFHEIGYEAFDLDRPVSQVLASCPRVYFTDRADAKVIDAFEFWEHIFRTPIELILPRWAIKFLQSHNLDISNAPMEVARAWGSQTGHSSDSPDEHYLALMAIGEGWFREMHAPRLPMTELMTSIASGTTFSEMITKLEVYFDDDQILLYEVIQVLRAYREVQPIDSASLPSITEVGVLRAAQEWIRANQAGNSQASEV